MAPPIHQGLDLTGGLSMEFMARNPKAATPDAMSAAIDIITKRVNAFGVSEPIVTQIGSDAIDVEMPGVRDPEVVRQTIGSTGELVLYGMGSLNPLQDGATFPYSNTTTLCDAKNAPTPCVVMKGSELDSSQIGSSFDQYGQPIVTFGAKGGRSGPSLDVHHGSRRRVHGLRARRQGGHGPEDPVGHHGGQRRDQ